MSVAFLADRSQSRFTTRHLHDAAAKLNVEIPDGSEAEDYLHLLQSAEAVMTHIETSADYIHPALVPVETTAPRVYWKPGIRDEKDDNPLNAWSHRCEIAAARPTSQLLFGRSIAIKDNVTIGGLPTTVGTFPELLSRDGDGRDLPVSPIDATVVSRLVAAGAVIKGSSTCENYCASPLSYSAASGPVDNPWLHGYTAGGSSSGSAALVAATVLAQKGTERSFGETVDLAIGSDQGGSIRIPASFNGIYGLKPTYGLIPYTGAVSLSPMIDHLGLLATNLEDIARLLFVMAGYDSLDPRMTPESPLRDQVKDYPRLLAEYRTSTSTINTSTIGKSERTRLRVGLLMEAFDAPGLTEEVRDTVLQAAKDSFTAAGADVVNISIPMHCEGPLIWTAATRMSMSEWACQGKTSGHLSFLPPHVQPRWPPDQRMYDLITATNPAAMNVMLSGPFLQDHFGPAVEAKAHRKVFELRAAYDRVFEGEEEEKVDVLVTPCAPTVAMPHPKMNADDAGPRSTVMEKLMVAVGVTSNTAPFNATGHPALSVPCGYGSAGSEAGVRLPIGMQVVGKRWDDEMVLKAAVVFEAGNELLRS